MTPRRWFAIFAAVLALTAALLVMGLFRAMNVVRQPGYAASTGDPAIQLQDSVMTLRNTACDVVIDGDSTANVGIDPRLITQQTGLTACNIATNRPNTDDLGTLPLDHFLANNPKPKLIVFQFGPEEFYRAKSPWEHVGPYTPLLLLSRNFPQRDALRIMAQHPAETTQFVIYILQACSGCAIQARARTRAAGKRPVGSEFTGSDYLPSPGAAALRAAGYEMGEQSAPQI